MHDAAHAGTGLRDEKPAAAIKHPDNLLGKALRMDVRRGKHALAGDQNLPNKLRSIYRYNAQGPATH